MQPKKDPKAQKNMKKTLKGEQKKGTNQHNKLTRTKGSTGPKYTREGVGGGG